MIARRRYGGPGIQEGPVPQPHFMAMPIINAKHAKATLYIVFPNTKTLGGIWRESLGVENVDVDGIVWRPFADPELRLTHPMRCKCLDDQYYKEALTPHHASFNKQQGGGVAIIGIWDPREI